MKRVVRVYVISVPEVVLNRTKRTIRRSGRTLTQIYVEHQKQRPLIRLCLDYEKAKLQEAFYASLAKIDHDQSIVQADKIGRILAEREAHEQVQDQ